MPSAVTTTTCQDSDADVDPSLVGPPSAAAEDDDDGVVLAGDEGISLKAPARADGSEQLQVSGNKRRAAKRHDKRVMMRHQRDADLASLRQMAAHLMCGVCRLRQLEVATTVEALACRQCHSVACSGIRCTTDGCEGFNCDTCCLLELQENIAFYSRIAS